MSRSTVQPTATGDGVGSAVSPDLDIPALPGSMAQDVSDAPPLLLHPLRFFEQAWLGRNAWWRYLLAAGLFMLLVVAVSIGLSALSVTVFSLINGLRSAEAAMNAFGRSGVLMFSLLMAASALGLPILFLVVRLIHRRSWRSLLIGPQGFDWSGFSHSLGLCLAIGCFIFFLEQTFWPGAARLAFDADRFWPFLALAIVLVPLQTLAEEAIFRGYVLQGVARATGVFAIRLVVPALLFAGLHFNNAAVVTGGIWGALEFVVVALYLTYLTLRGDGIEHAWGFHLGNNWLAFVLIRSTASDFNIPSLFVVDGVIDAWGLVYAAITCALHYGLLLRFSAQRLVRRTVAGGTIAEAARG